MTYIAMFAGMMMQNKTLQNLGNKHADISHTLGDRLFFLGLSLCILSVDITAYIFLACFYTIAPAIFITWLILKVPAIPGGVKVFLVAFLTLGSCFILAFIFGPFSRRMGERKKRLFSVIDEWAAREKVLSPEEINK